MKISKRFGPFIALAALLTGGALLARGGEFVARAELAGPAGSDLRGTVTFTEMDGVVSIVAEIEGAPPGVHGFHLHEKGDCSATDFTSTGGHFNPGESEHGAPDGEMHHAGDFGNIVVDEGGKGRLELESSAITVSDGPLSVRGRGLILHANADDLKTQPTGAAGGRIACAVVVPAARD